MRTVATKQWIVCISSSPMVTVLVRTLILTCFDASLYSGEFESVSVVLRRCRCVIVKWSPGVIDSRPPCCWLWGVRITTINVTFGKRPCNGDRVENRPQLFSTLSHVDKQSVTQARAVWRAATAVKVLTGWNFTLTCDFSVLYEVLTASSILPPTVSACTWRVLQICKSV